MKYQYTTAWVLSGGFNLPKDSDEISLFSSENKQFYLTNKPDNLLNNVDIYYALGNMALIGGIGESETGNVRQAALDEQIDNIREARSKKIGQRTVLIFQTTDEIDIQLKGKQFEYENFAVSFEQIDTGHFNKLHKPEIDTMKIALTCQSDHPIAFEYLTSGFNFLSETKKTIFNFSFSMSNISGYVSTPLIEEFVSNIGAMYAGLKDETSLASVYRLFARMTEHDSDNQRAYLAGWTAFERLINKTFSKCEQTFLQPFLQSDQSELRGIFLDRIQDVMKMRYRLKDKFIAITAVLFPSISGAEAESLVKDFARLKAFKDDISHGNPVSENSLPVSELASMLRKYLKARTESDI
ncbi:MAG: hypothetical protein JXX14_10895 [Deltaproteobacteria bacterium]|nr:hypothetical protein [Deltaproteobacteria bacterium]